MNFVSYFINVVHFLNNPLKNSKNYKDILLGYTVAQLVCVIEGKAHFFSYVMDN